MKVNLKKSKVVFSRGITKDGLSRSNVDPCGICAFRVKVIVLCVKCGEQIYSTYAGTNRVTPMFSRDFADSKWDGVRGSEHEQKFCDGVETVRAFICLNDTVRVSG